MSLRGSFELPTRRIELELAQPCLVIDAAEQAGIVLNTSCARLGTCGGCAVDLLQGRFELAGQTVTVGPPDRKRVLGCQCTILSDRWRIAVPRRSLVETHETFLVDFDLRPTFNLQPLARKIRLHLPRPSLEDSVGDFERICRTLRRDHGFERIRPTLRVLQQLPELIAQADYQLTVTLAENYGLWEMVQVEPGDTSDRLFAIAADIGTTTVACCLIDLTTGRIIDSASCYNQQIQRCDDVASRIVYAQQPHRLRELQQLIVGQTINKLISLLCRNNGLRPDEVVRLVVSGNTVMAHLFLGINPKNMGGVPFQPGTSGPGTFRARPLAVGINPDGFVDIVPSISAYVGGDIISDIHVAGLARQQGLALLIDVGTNGEMAVGNADRILACATPAGPAFEGGGITCGTRATAGAIHALTIESDSLAAACQVIADLKPIGVCGSGLIDFLAEARRVGLIDHAGRFNPRLVGTCPYLRQTASHDRGRFEYVLVPRQATEDRQQDIVITEKDIAQLLQAKAVIYAGIVILMKNIGLTCNDLDRIYLAGAFARHINLVNAITIGLLPDLPLDRFRVLGNASLAGAFLAAVDAETWSAFDQIVTRPRVIELNTDPDFQDEYTFAMFLPNLRTDRFPGVMRRLQQAGVEPTRDGSQP